MTRVRISISVRIQHRDVVRAHHLGGHDAVAVLAARCGKRDDVVALDVSQRPEERVAVPGDSDIAGLSRQCRPSDVPGRAPERGLVGSFDDDHGDAQARNLDAADQAVRS